MEAPSPFTLKPTLNDNKIKLIKEYSKKGNNEKEDKKITLGIINDSFQIYIKEGITIYKGLFNLKDLQEKDKYFRMFDTIEEAYNEILPSFNENQYNIINEGNNMILNIEIEHSHKKNTISFVLEKNKINKEDLIESLYNLTNKYIKENNGLKGDILILSNKIDNLDKKINSIESKIDLIINNIKNKEEKKEKEFENVLKNSKILSTKHQINLLKSWLPFKNKINCKLIYDAKRDGDSARVFHSLCDNKENTLTIISTSDNKIIGGFLSQSFGVNKGDISDNNSFLFSLNYNEKYPSLNEGKNFVYNKNEGPIFGYYCIYIKDNCLSSNKNYYESYTTRYDFGNRNSSKEHYFKVNELEIYQIYE